MGWTSSTGSGPFMPLPARPSRFQRISLASAEQPALDPQEIAFGDVENAAEFDDIDFGRRTDAVRIV